MTNFRIELLPVRQGSRNCTNWLVAITGSPHPGDRSGDPSMRFLVVPLRGGANKCTQRLMNFSSCRGTERAWVVSDCVRPWTCCILRQNWPDNPALPCRILRHTRGSPSHGNDVRRFLAALREPCECRRLPISGMDPINWCVCGGQGPISERALARAQLNQPTTPNLASATT